MVKKLEATIKEVKLNELPSLLLSGKRGGMLGTYQKEKGEKKASINKPLILVSGDLRRDIVVLAKVRPNAHYSEGVNPRKEVEYLVLESEYDSRSIHLTIARLMNYYREYTKD